MNNHLKTAHDFGVQEALKKCGYDNVGDVQKEAQDLGLFDESQAQPKTAEDNSLARLASKLG